MERALSVSISLSFSATAFGSEEFIYDKNWSFTLGYAYDRWRYSDQAYNGYQYTIPFPGVSTNTGQSYLNGYNAFTNYVSNIVYLLATYKFNNLGLGM
jgi:hypothetical protein